MKIKTRLFTIAIISVMVAVSMGSVVLTTNRKILKEEKYSNIIGSIAGNLTELETLTYEYFLHRGKRTQIQWKKKLLSINENINILKESKGLSSDILDEMQMDIKNIDNDFKDLYLVTKKRAGLDREHAALSIKYEDRLKGRLIVNINDIVFRSIQIDKTHQERLNILKANTMWILIIFVLIMTATTGVFAVVTSKKISNPIIKLCEAAAVLGAGKLDIVVDVETKDEIGELAESFNSMAQSLRENNQALIESEERLRLAIDSVHAGTWDWDILTGDVRWDARMQEIFGLNPGSYKGTYEAWAELVHPDDRKRADETTWYAINTGCQYECEYRVKANGNGWRHVDAHAIVLRDELLRPVRMTGVAVDITGKKDADALIKSERERLFSILDGIPAFIYLQSKDYSIDFANKYFKEHFGGIDNLLCFEALWGIKKPCAVCPTFKVFKTQKPQVWEWDKAPDNRVYQVHDYPFRDLDGSLKVLELGMDITELKNKENELEQHRNHLKEMVDARTKELKKTNRSLVKSEEKLKKIFDLSIDMICVSEIGGKFLSVNPAFEKILGYSETELLSQPYINFVHPDDKGKTTEIIERRLMHGKPVINFENRYCCKDGSCKWLMWTSQPIPNEGITFAIARDITDKKLAEEKIKHLASFPQLSANPILEVNASMDITFVNTTAIKILNEKSGKKDNDIKLFLPKDIDAIVKQLEQDRNMQFYREIKIGEKIFGENINLVPQFKVARVYGKDITAQKKAESELEKASNHLVHAEKLAAIGKLSASIAHEFNNPISGIKNVLDTAAQRYSKENINEYEEKLINMGIKECDRVADLIHKLRDFNRPSSGIETMTDVNREIEDVLLIYRKGIIEKGIELKTQLEDNLPKIKIVADQLKQVILNLVQNAEESITDKKGSITVTTRLMKSNIYINIRDTGDGIPEKNRGSIFEPFFSTKPAVKGTGLGLSVCHGIVKKFNGEIIFESKEGKGTTFIVVLPVTGESC